MSFFMNGEYNKNLGQWGEKTAEKYLVSRGYRIIERHWQKREGEIDLIAFDQPKRCLVFIEVKTRTSESFGLPEEAVNWNKLRKLEMLIDYYVQEALYAGAYRFDVIAIRLINNKAYLKHLTNLALI